MYGLRAARITNWRNMRTTARTGFPETSEPQVTLQVPERPEELGLPESTIEQLILKLLYLRGDLFGRELACAMGLQFNTIYRILDLLKYQHVVQIKHSHGDSHVSSVYTLTESGHNRARDAMEMNHYAGPAPVPLSQYVEIARAQRPPAGWLSEEVLRAAYEGVVITPSVLAQIGHAVSSGNSFLIYGKPGNGKTFLAEALTRLQASPVYLPYALEHHGHIIQYFDPLYHERVGEAAQNPETTELDYDGRWVKCKRPFIMTGGELALEMLDLSYNQVSKVYDAPFQLKANNGIYLLDDFGRQRATPAEVLNRWIVPMERRVDFLNLRSGGKMKVPFEAFLVFSTNLKPENLGDEAFLRRIQYKMLLRGPDEQEFSEIFRRFCATNRLMFSEPIIHYLFEKYRGTRKPMRRCHPRDILSHAIDLIHFEKLPLALNEDVLDRAFESCFVQEDEDDGGLHQLAAVVDRHRAVALAG